MNLADLSIKRPIFMSCLVLLMLVAGYVAFRSIPVDLFPDVSFPYVVVHVAYDGAGPEEMENLVNKPLEEVVSSLGGVKKVSSFNREGTTTIVIEFNSGTDIKYAEQQVRDRVDSVKSVLPEDIDEPVIMRFDPSDHAIMMLSVAADLPDGELYDVVKLRIKNRLEQLDGVGRAEIVGGREREIQVLVDRQALQDKSVSLSSFTQALALSGRNTSVGKEDSNQKEKIIRSLGDFHALEQIGNTALRFWGNEIPLLVNDVASVSDTLKDEKSRAFLNGQKALALNIFKQSGINTLSVTRAIHERVAIINKELSETPGHPQVRIVRDGAIWIENNVTDVKESILIGIILTVIVVYFFLGNARSTLITGLALPNSLIGAFILMSLAGFSINVMTLLALSLSVGLLVDDAIVVRENIFRHLEMGKNSFQAARDGTKEVSLAVIATTLTVMSVFGPIAYLHGVVGQFFREFGFTICFAIAISLFDALTMAPMLSAYFAGAPKTTSRFAIIRWLRTPVDSFGRFQDKLELAYERLLRFVTAKPKTVLMISFVIFILACLPVKWIPKTFMPEQDAGEFMIQLDLPPGTTLDDMTKLGLQVDDTLKQNSEILYSALTIGSTDAAESNKASFFIRLTPSQERKANTTAIKERIRQQLKPFERAKPKVFDFDPIGGAIRPFNLDLMGNHPEELNSYAQKIYERLKNYPALKDVDIDIRAGGPELQIKLDPQKAQQLGLTTALIGEELRNAFEGKVPALFRDKGQEYDVRVRLNASERTLDKVYADFLVPNLNGRLVKLADAATLVNATGPGKINRKDRIRLVNISADIAPGAGIGDIMQDINQIMKTEIPKPNTIYSEYVGDAENFQELGENILFALVLGIVFIYMVLASLYESFITPLSIMLALPLAICGSFLSLWLAGKTLDIFSMIGCIMLMGIACKNSILLIDYTNQLMQRGHSRTAALIEAGKTRLRPILMTSMALIAGTIPLVLGLNEVSRQRTSMGYSILGGLISSTLLSLVVVPAGFLYIDRLNDWIRKTFRTFPQLP